VRKDWQLWNTFTLSTESPVMNTELVAPTTELEKIPHDNVYFCCYTVSAMTSNNKIVISLFLILIMLCSIGFMSSDSWNEETDEEDRSIIDYSLMEGNDEQRLAPADGECWKVLVVPVTFQDFSNLPHRYNKEELEEFLDEDVDNFLSVSTYNSWCADWTVAPEFIPSIDDDPDTDEDESKSTGTNEVALNIRDSESHGDLASSHSIIGMIYNIPSYGGQSKGWTNYPAFKVTGLGAFTNSDTTYLCDDDGASKLNGDPAWASSGCYVRGDFLGLFSHELLHAMGVGGHAATLYRQCHSLMGDLSCSGPAPPSSWLKLDKGWYPKEFAYMPDGESLDVQEIQIRPLNLNLLDEISGVPNSEQIQIVKIPLSNEVNQFDEPDPNHYLLIEYRPKETLNSNGDKEDIIGNADNIVHKRQWWGGNTYNGLPSEGVMIYTINEFHNTNPNPITKPGSSKFEPVRVIDANPSTTKLNDAAFTAGDVYQYGVEGMPYRVTIEIENMGINAEIKVSYETPALNGWEGEGPDMFITPTPKYDGSTPTVTTDIWIDSPSNNFDIDNADNDDDVTTGMDAIYRWHEPGDPRTPLEGLSDAPELDQENWLYVRVKNIGDTPIDFSTSSISLTWRKPDVNGAVPSDKYHHIGYAWDAQQPVCPPQGIFAWGSFCEKNNPSDSYIEYGLMELKEKDGNPTDLWRVREPSLKSADTHPIDWEFILGKDEEFIIGGIWKPKQSLFDWIDPSTQEGLAKIHACIDVRIFPVANEMPIEEYDVPDQAEKIFVDIPEYYPNNWAFENIGYFEVYKGSPYNTIQGEFDLWNNLPHTVNATIELIELPEGMTVTLSPETPLQMATNESATFEYEISIDDDWPIGHFDGFDFQAWLETNISGDIHNFPVAGGLRIVVASVEQVEVEVDVIFNGEAIVVDGNMVSQGFTSEGEDYSGSVVAMEYWTPDGISILRPASINAGTDTCTARFSSGSSIEIVYTSPTGQTSISSRTMNANGEYMDSFMMQDTGNWTVSYTYTDLNGNSYQWDVLVPIFNRTGQLAPIAEGYDKTCGIGVFSDTFTGTADTPLQDGVWNVRVIFAGDLIHRSAMTENQSVLLEGLPPVVAPDIIIDPTFTPTLTWGDDYLGSGTLYYPIATGANIAVLYTSPSGVGHHGNLSVDAQGRYSNTYSMDESGTWIVDYSYTDSNGVDRSWSESIDVEAEERESTGIPSVGLLTTIAIIMFSAIITVRRWD